MTIGKEKNLQNMGNTWPSFGQSPGDDEQPTKAAPFGWQGVDPAIERKAMEMGRPVGGGVGLGMIDDLGLSPDDGWVVENRAHPIPTRAADPATQRMLHYMRAIPKRCHVVVVNRRTGQEMPMLTPEGGRLLCLALDTEALRDFMAYMDEKAARRERAALLREMSANALALSRRRQIPSDVYESIRNLCREGLDAKRQRDSAKS